MIIHVVFLFLVVEKNNNYLSSPHFFKQYLLHLLFESTQHNPSLNPTANLLSASRPDYPEDGMIRILTIDWKRMDKDRTSL